MTKIYVYNPKHWKAPPLLAKALRDRGLDAKATSKANLLSKADLVVCWGFRAPNEALNNHIVGNKYRELEMLKNAGVNVPNFSQDKPEVDGWLARTLKHRAGNDLAANLMDGDFYVQKIDNVAHEFRVHVFGDKIIRAGIKVATENAHPWIRSLKQGWQLDYGQACQNVIKNKVRKAAKAAIKALNYDFGAVDVALLTSGKVIVFEVNSAPGLVTPNTAIAYAKTIEERFCQH